MYRFFSFLLFCFSFEVVTAIPDAPFPIAASSFGPNQASLINNDVQSFLATVTAASDFRAAVTAFAAITDAGLLHDYRGDPNQLALEYFTATATPTWWAELPKPVQTYIQRVGNAEAAIESSDAALTVSEPTPTSTGPAPAATTTAKGAGEPTKQVSGLGVAMGVALGIAVAGGHIL